MMRTMINDLSSADPAQATGLKPVDRCTMQMMMIANVRPAANSSSSICWTQHDSSEVYRYETYLLQCLQQRVCQWLWTLCCGSRSLLCFLHMPFQPCRRQLQIQPRLHQVVQDAFTESMEPSVHEVWATCDNVILRMLGDIR